METDRTKIAAASAEVAYVIGYLRSLELGTPWGSPYRTEVLDSLDEASRLIQGGLYPRPLAVVRDEADYLLGFERTSLDGPDDWTLR